MTDTPVHKHDCDQCVFLGVHVQPDGVNVDMYWCHSPSMASLCSVLGRYSDEGADYVSSNPPEAFAGPEHYLKMAQDWYHAAMVEAKRRGLYRGKHVFRGE